MNVSTFQAIIAVHVMMASCWLRMAIIVLVRITLQSTPASVLNAACVKVLIFSHELVFMSANCKITADVFYVCTWTIGLEGTRRSSDAFPKPK